jgi:exopolysaccharide biosynthesis polyprenyl glycosylphosphotransferase
MKTTERAALRDSAILFEDLIDATDERTLRILDRRRKTATIHRRGWLTRRLLAVADAAGLVAAMVVVQLVFGSGGGPGDRLTQVAEIGVFALMLPVWLVAAKLYGLFDRDEKRSDHTTADDVVTVIHVVTLGAWVLFVGSWWTGIAHPALPKIAAFWTISIVAIALGRTAARAFGRQRMTYLQNTVIVGAGDVGQLVARKFLQDSDCGINLVGFLDSDPRQRAPDLAHIPVLGPFERLPAVVRLLDVERVVVAFSADSHERTLELVRSLKDLDVQIDIVPRLFEIVGPNVALHTIGGLPLMGLPALHISRSSLLVKRMMDMLVSSVGLVLLSPLFAYVAIRIKRDSPGPVFYRHERIGPGGCAIRLFKFRTMYTGYCRGSDYGGDEAEQMFADLLADPTRRAEFEASQKLEEDPRITRYGAVLRRRSLDELPQLINVLIGELSLVGPRPVTEEELERYGSGVDALLNLRPGITGWWQINGRSNLSYTERVRLDMAYVGSWSLRLDLRILVKTLRTVMHSRGAY